MDLDTVSKLLNVPKSTLRYWERKGLITAERRENNYRYYGSRYVVDISDILLFRKINVHLNEINNIKGMISEELEDYYKKLSDDIEIQIEILLQTKCLINKRKKLVERIQEIENNKFSITEFYQLNIPENIVRFDITDINTMTNYLDHPFDNQYVLLWRPNEYDHYDEGWIVRNNDLETEVLWRPNQKNKKSLYLRCLLECDGASNKNNNLHEILQYMRDRNMQPGFIVAEYLHEAFSKKQQKIISYYDAYIEILEES